MRLASALVAVLLVVAPGGVVRGQAPREADRSPVDSMRAVEGVRRAEDELREAFLRADTATLARLHAEGFVLTNIKAERGSKPGRLRLIGGGEYRFRRFDVDEREVRVFAPNVAVVTERIRYAGSLGGQEVELVTYRVTNVWVASGGRWQLAATQGTLVPPP